MGGGAWQEGRGTQWPGAAGWGSVASRASFQLPPHGAGSQAGGGGGGVDGVSGGPQPGCSAPRASPLSAGSAVFSLSRADPFSAISNNVTASLVSIHQSRKKPILTLIKKKKIPSVPPGDRESSVPTAGTPPPSLPFPCTRRRRGNQIPQGSPPTPGPSSPPPGRLSQGGLSPWGPFQLTEFLKLIFHSFLVVFKH